MIEWLNAVALEFGFFLRRISILCSMLSLSFIVSIKYSSNFKFSKIVPFFCASLMSIFTYFYLYVYAAGEMIHSDSYRIYNLYLKENLVYPYAVGYSHVIIIFSKLTKLSSLEVIIIIGLIFCPFALYLTYFFVGRIFLTEKLANIASLIFLTSDIVFAGFVSNVKQNFCMIFLLLCLYYILYEAENHNNKQRKILIAISFFLMSSIHLFTFLIGNIILVAVIEGKNWLKKKKEIIPNNDLLLILLIIPISISVFYPNVSQLLFNYIFYPLPKILDINIGISEEVSLFLKNSFDILNEIPIFTGILISISFYLFSLLNKFLLEASTYIENGFKRISYIIEEYDNIIFVTGIILSLCTWILYSLYYRNYILSNYYNIFGFIFIHIGQILLYGVSFYLIIRQFLPSKGGTERIMQIYEKSFFLASFFLLLFSLLTLLALLLFVPFIGNLERRFLDFLPLIQIYYFLFKFGDSNKFQRSQKSNLLFFVICFFLCLLGMLIGSRDQFIFSKEWPELK